LSGSRLSCSRIGHARSHQLGRWPDWPGRSETRYKPGPGPRFCGAAATGSARPATSPAGLKNCKPVAVGFQNGSLPGKCLLPLPAANAARIAPEPDRRLRHRPESNHAAGIEGCGGRRPQTQMPEQTANECLPGSSPSPPGSAPPSNGVGPPPEGAGAKSRPLCRWPSRAPRSALGAPAGPLP